ncbi:MAG: molybdopterin-synthase adenylyltransferase MoeB [Oscillospiraceae bacterium]
MQITVYVAATLRGFVNKQPKIAAEGSTVREVIQNIRDEYPDSQKALFDEEGKLRPFVSVYVNDNRIPERDWDTPVSEKDALLLLPAIAGGAPTESVIPEERRKQTTLDDNEIERFNRHLLLKEISVKGQKRIKAARVLVIGLGALGSPVVQYLAAAGVGTLGVADSNEVALGDIQSQIIHGTRDVHRPKTASAKDTIRAINPKIKVEAYSEELTADNISDIIEDYDIVVDCSDNYRSRYLINDACALAGKPVVFGAVYQFEGQVSVFDAANGACFRCQYPSPPPAGLVPTCASGGVISPLPGIIGSIQANEVLKLIIGGGETLRGKLLVIDSWNLTGRIVNVHKDENCPVCGRDPTICEVEDYDYDDFCGLKQEENEEPVEGIEPEELVHRIESGEPLTIIDVREPHERAICRFPNAIAIPIGQLTRRQKELDPEIDTIFICREGKRSILAINTLREAGYKGSMYNLKGGFEAAKNIIFSNEGAWL